MCKSYIFVTKRHLAMLRLLAMLLVLATSIPASAQVVNSHEWAQIQVFAAANDSLRHLPQECRRVVFIGNSITELWSLHRPQFFQRYGFVGRGISGQTSSQMLLRFRQDVVSLHPEAVVIGAGTNDVAENTGPYDEGQTMDNIRSMADLARANDIKVVLTSVLPAAGFRWRKTIKDAPEKIASLNACIRRYAEAHHMPYIDYYSVMLAPDGRSLNPAYTYDGVHPTIDGFAVMEQQIEECGALCR